MTPLQPVRPLTTAARPAGAEDGRSSAESPRPAPVGRLRLAWQILSVRLRFVVIFLIAFLIVGNWSFLRNWWNVFTRAPSDASRQAISPNTEYFCPMCPGVLSDWPAKCPVCNMALVRRTRGEMTPLPDGVLARMQFSPYRVQLAGIRTVPVEYRELVHTVELAGLIEVDDASRGWLRGGLLPADAPLVTTGQSVELTAAALPGQPPYTGRVRALGTPAVRGALLPVTIAIDHPGPELRSGMAATARIQVPVSRLPWFEKAIAAAARQEIAFELALQGLFAPAGPGLEGSLPPLLRSAQQAALARQGLLPCVPASAVIDTGARQVVYVQSGPGMFDAVAVVLGPRCGDYVPVVSGVVPGQQVTTAGAFLIDAETRLNPSVAASYFGATRGGGPPAPTHAAPTAAEQAAITEALAQLSAADRAAALRQKNCPVTGEPLGSMGVPCIVEASGRRVFLCCKGCEAELKRHPAEYLAKLPAP